MSDGQKQQPCPSGPGMTPLMASHKEAGAMGWLGRDRLNLCEGAGAGEGTAAPAKTARPSALPPGGPEPEVSVSRAAVLIISKSKSKCYPSYRVWAGAFRPSRRSVAAGQQPVSFDWSWDSHLLWTPQSQTTHNNC